MISMCADGINLLGITLNVPKSVTKTSTAFTAVTALSLEPASLYGVATTAPPTPDELIVCFTVDGHIIVSGDPP